MVESAGAPPAAMNACCTGCCAKALTRRWLFGGAAALGSRAALRAAAGTARQARRRRARPAPGRARVHARKVLLLQRLHPAGDGAIDRCRHRARARCHRRAGAWSTRARVAAAPSVIICTTSAARCDNARRNIDAWWPQLESGAVEAIVDQCLGLHGDGQGIRTSCCAPIRPTPPGRAASATRRAIWPNSWARSSRRCSAAPRAAAADPAARCRNPARCSTV